MVHGHDAKVVVMRRVIMLRVKLKLSQLVSVYFFILLFTCWRQNGQIIS